MPRPPPVTTFRFNRHVVDVRARALRAGPDEIPLEPKASDCLPYLVQHRDRAVGRDELISAVWGKVDVSDAMLGQAVLKARRALGDSGRAQEAIGTVSRFGYQWIAPIEELATAEAGSGATPSAAITGGRPPTAGMPAPARNRRQ